MIAKDPINLYTFEDISRKKYCKTNINRSSIVLYIATLVTSSYSVAFIKNI